MIEAIIYSYKNKNLKIVVDSLLENTDSEIIVNVYDQNPIDRSAHFAADNVKYNHIRWDSLSIPCEIKGDFVNKSSGEYVLVLSDDIILKKSWDVYAIDYIEDRSVALSGYGKILVKQDNPFYLSVHRIDFPDYSISNYIDKNFIFASKKNWEKVEYPYKLKYNGENESLSVNFFRSGVDVCSLPSDFVKDLGQKTIESLYVPYSINHGYNESINKIISDRNYEKIRSLGDFEKFHRIDFSVLQALPFGTDDVSYDPYGLNFQDIDARKFISRTKAVY